MYSLGVWNKLQKLLQFVLYISRGFLNALSFFLTLPSWTVATKTILQYSLPAGLSPSITIITPLASLLSLYKSVQSRNFLKKSFYCLFLVFFFFLWQGTTSHCKWCNFCFSLYIFLTTYFLIVLSSPNISFQKALYCLRCLRWVPTPHPPPPLSVLGFDKLNFFQKLGNIFSISNCQYSNCIPYLFSQL